VVSVASCVGYSSAIIGFLATYTKTRQTVTGIGFQEFALAHIHSRPLTDVSVKNLKPGTTLPDTGDHKGLRANRTKTGVTSFLYRYRSPAAGQSLRQITLGYYPLMSLAEARAELQVLKAKRKSGICPAAERRAVEAEKCMEVEREASDAVLSAFMVTDMVEAYLIGYIEDKKDLDGSVIRRGARKPKGQSEVRRTLYGDAVRVLGSHPSVEVTSKNVYNLVMEIVDRGANVQAGNVLRELKAAFDYCIGDQLPEDFVNPCYQAVGQLKRKRIRLNSVRGKRVLSDTELTQLIAWIPGSSFTPTQKSVLLLTLMTGCRTGEICGAKWRDIDLDAGTWYLRETKTGEPRIVQLSRQAVDYLRRRKRLVCQFSKSR
jgi:hypothetical protein